MKYTHIIYLVLVLAQNAFAVPAKRQTRIFNIEGKDIPLTLVGDESVHYWVDNEGCAYQLNEDDNVVPFDLSQLSNTSIRRIAQRITSPQKTNQKRAANQYVGTKRGVVILANFKDKKFSCTTTPLATYKQVLSEIGYSGYGQFGSVRDYFLAQSYGQFDFVLDVVGPVELSQNMAYYGANDSAGNDMRPTEMIAEACKLADDEIDFSKYDWDGDGVVEQIFVIYAGYGESQGASSYTIWPHAWDMESSTGSMLAVDGVHINAYACGCELNGRSGKKMDGIGTICHEFSHCFGLPDFYDTEYNIDFTMGAWSIMDYGSYNNDGYCPAAYTAYERWFCGWLQPIELDSPQYIKNLADINESGQCYVIYNKKHPDEYYMLQNIQQQGWNKYAPAHGMLVLHVDYDEDDWYDNIPNNDSSHLRMTPVCADNKQTSSSISADLFPGTTNNTSLTNDTKPSAKLFNKNSDGGYYLNRPIEDIAETDQMISFTFNHGEIITPPMNLHVSEITGTSFDLSWDRVEAALSYTIEYGDYNQNESYEKIIYVDQAFKFSVTNDGAQDIAKNLDSYLELKGFTGQKIYVSPNGLKIGSSKMNGFITSPTICVKGEQLNVCVTASPYGNNKSSIQLSSIDEIGNVVDSTQPILITDNNQIISATLTTNPTTRIQISANKRIYLSAVAISNDTFTPYATSVELDNIVDTRTHIIHTSATNLCYARICALGSASNKSEWSDYIVFSTIPTTVQSPNLNVSKQETYTPEGNKIDFLKAHPGIYVVKIGDKFAKVLKK